MATVALVEKRVTKVIVALVALVELVVIAEKKVTKAIVDSG